MHVIHQTGAQVLLHGGDAAAQPDIFSVRSLFGALQSSVDALDHKVESCTSMHHDGRASVMGKNKDGYVVSRTVAPPAFPTVVRPRPAHRTKHVAPENPGSDTLEAAHDHIIVEPCFAALIAMHLVMSMGGKLPAEYGKTTHADGISKILVRTGTVAVKRHREAMNTKSGHQQISQLGASSRS